MTPQGEYAIKFVRRLRSELETKILKGTCAAPTMPIDNQLLEYRLAVMTIAFLEKTETDLIRIFGKTGDVEDESGLTPQH